MNRRQLESVGDARFMLKAIRLAHKGIGQVFPNPPVGAVAVRAGKVIATGYHKVFGSKHAEADLISSAKKRSISLKNADLYVSLEPCSHTAKTPPCCQAIIDSGFARVFYAVEDPHSVNRGRGPRQMKKAGIFVERGLLEDQARQLLAPFFKWITSKRPLVHAKWAMTIDGKSATASGHSQWVSSSESLKKTRRERSLFDAIMIGSGTLHSDDPLLTSRPDNLRNPIRVVVDRKLSIGLNQQLVNSIDLAPVWLFCSKEAHAQQEAKARKLEALGVKLYGVRESKAGLSMKAVFSKIGSLGITNLLLEGGPALIGNCLDQGLVDRVQIIVAPKICGGANATTAIGGIGVRKMSDSLQLLNPTWSKAGHDHICTSALTNFGLGIVDRA